MSEKDASRLELPYARLLPACLAFCPEPRRMLIVGLGGGSLPRFFHAHWPEMQIDVVELDPVVLDVARQFCGFREGPRVRVYIEDGRDFVEASAGIYDVIILDSFDAESIPPHLTTQQFLEATRAALSPAGVVIANVWGPALNPIYAEMLATYRTAFPEIYVLDVPKPNTKLFVALQHEEDMTRERFMENANDIRMQYGLPYDLVAEVAGFRHARLEKTRCGRVLRD